MTERRPNPAIPADQRCVSCSGWGGHIIHRGGDNYEDSQKCLECKGSGRAVPVIDLLGALQSSIERARKGRTP